MPGRERQKKKDIMEPIIRSDYLNDEQVVEAKEDFLAVKTIDDAFELLEKIDSFVRANATSDEKYLDLHNCLLAIRKVSQNEELSNIQTLTFLSPTLGIAMVGMLVLVGIFSEDELRIAFAEKASLFNQAVNHDA